MDRQQDFDARVEEIVTEIRTYLQNIHQELNVADDHEVMAVAEDAIQQMKRLLGERSQEALMSFQIRKRDVKEQVCQCGQRMNIKDRRLRGVYGLHGHFSFRRRYFICPSCNAKALPVDDAMKLSSGFTEKLIEAASLVGVMHSSRQGSFLLEKLTGVHIAHSTLHQMTVAAGEDLQEISSTQLVGDKMPRSTRVGYLSADGVHVNTLDGWREMKLGCLYDEAQTVLHYVATFDQCNAFGQKLRELASRADVGRAQTVIAIADGAAWIWEQVRTRLPFASVEIVDFYHAAENIGKAAKEMYGEGTPQAKEWLQKKRRMLRRQGVGRLLDTLVNSRRYRNRDPAMVRLVNYLRSHRHRMEYPTFHRRGYDIGSGMIESSCKNVVQARLKGCGMRWTLHAATAVANLRALFLSGYWDDFQAMRRAA